MSDSATVDLYYYILTGLNTIFKRGNCTKVKEETCYHGNNTGQTEESVIVNVLYSNILAIYFM